MLKKIPEWKYEESTDLVNVGEGTGGCERQRCQDAGMVCDLKNVFNFNFLLIFKSILIFIN
jgi:hypothetical protein